MAPRYAHATILAVLLASISAASAEDAPAPCTEDTAPVVYARKADMPPGAAEALGFPMAEAGETFQATDVISKQKLPWRRFMSARKTACRIQVEVEHGGIGLRHESFDLELSGGKWVIHKP